MYASCYSTKKLLHLCRNASDIGSSAINWRRLSKLHAKSNGVMHCRLYSSSIFKSFYSFGLSYIPIGIFRVSYYNNNNITTVTYCYYNSNDILTIRTIGSLCMNIFCKIILCFQGFTTFDNVLL